MDIALKAMLFLGMVLLLGAGVAGRWLVPGIHSPRLRSFILTGLAAGAVLLVVGSLGDVFMTVTRILRGRIDLAVFFDYLLTTRHGVIILVRLGLVLLLAVWGARSFLSRRIDNLLYALVGLGLLATFALVSHSGVMGPLPLLGDLMHLVGAVLWAGAVLSLAWLPVWSERASLVRIVRRISAVGMTSVGLIALTGVYLATLHLFGLRALGTTPYGLALVVKVALVLVILAIAGLNRWLLVPRLERGGETRPLRLAVRLESLLLVGVLFATGVLTTREPAHDHAVHDHREHDAQHGPDRALPAVPATGASPNTFALATGPATIEPLLEEDGTFTLVLAGAGLEEGFEAVDPQGRHLIPEAERIPTHHGASELWLTLPSAERGRWELLGPTSEAFFFTVHKDEGTGATLFFTPTPSLAGGGLSEVFVYTNEPDPLFITYRMPSMEHAGDDERFELEHDPSYHDARAQARRATLSFPMVGTWEVTLLTAEGAHVFELEVMDD